VKKRPDRYEQFVCTNPYEWLEVHPRGDAFLCCPAWLKRPVGNVLTDSLETVWNSAVAMEIRASILNGSFHHCSSKRCPRRLTGSSPVTDVESLGNTEAAAAIQQGRKRLPYGPKVLNLCFDRSCNLSCPTCRRESFVSQGTALETSRLLAAKIVKEGGSSAEKLILSGEGDPFASPVYREMLRSFRKEDFPTLHAIDLHTNGQLWTATMWESMEAVHPFVRRAEISVDAATDATYAVNRPPGSFDNLLLNLEFIATLPLSVTLSFVVQRNNYTEIPAFVAMARGYGCKTYFSALVNWGTFSQEEFAERAVHLPDHPEHANLKSILGGVLGEKGVDFGNLTPLVKGH